MRFDPIPGHTLGRRSPGATSAAVFCTDNAATDLESASHTNHYRESALVRLRIFLPALVLAIATAGPVLAQSASSLVEITNAWIRPPTGDAGMVTAYFTIFNKSQEEEHLIRVETSAAERAIVQRMRIRDMRAVYETIPKLSIDAIERRKLRPGGYQVTLQRLTKPLRVGENILLTLTFERAGRIEVNARVSNHPLGNR
jgi:periplasmic copper chaperone A